ncbi:restriction endonuclease subunit S [Candidatus Pantoea bituminis]|uniref:restriction endonuclease subunit S n=1 Tax=Candidatus Pantoea bituminis TaxID=2831036 RepID=UPI001C061969|nr:restriction endonuclease subunit S [Pantoea bituminis]
MGSKWSSWALYELDITFEDGDRSSRYPKANEFLEYGNYPFLNTKNIVDGRLDLSEINFLSDQKFSEIKKGRVNPNDIIISTRGSQLGKVAFYSDHRWSQPLINAQLLIIRVKDERLVPEYLYLLLNSTDGKKQIEMLKSGSAQPQLPVRDLKKFIVNLPDIKIQKKHYYYTIASTTKLFSIAKSTKP